MKLPIYQVDAFAEHIFKGNPAAVCPLDEWLPDEVLQNIAMENNLSETAFFVEQEDGYRLRWFTPAIEVDLCGHATLASAHVLFEHLGYGEEIIRFDSNSGELKVRKNGGRLVMDFPSSELNTVEMPDNLEKALGITVKEVFQATDYLCILESEGQVHNLNPDFKMMSQIETRGIIVTAPGNEVDFISRFFAPAAGIDEDPVTGSAHTMLTPYWSKELGKTELTGHQVSKRGGILYCKQKGDRVELAGEARIYLKGEIFV
ncbi:MAG TPA: PhzF family phenazine biosynthesis protein [Balneolaceae bacterium]